MVTRYIQSRYFYLIVFLLLLILSPRHIIERMESGDVELPIRSQRDRGIKMEDSCAFRNYNEEIDFEVARAVEVLTGTVADREKGLHTSQVSALRAHVNEAIMKYQKQLHCESLQQRVACGKFCGELDSSILIS
ncbi:hypothetical protein DUNSADRAFT_5857 [Dunaliella salina]|uniref:Uncharacterized protein n=1 Tax=Dunaliella salina TaxID=3046 RepID=A0ABQ7FU35_DUNSA|nr:hypothetical protein DUNSADRAFT_5857 [Dunaliella salina]|eukprot:KAF5825929.1 hypothetical protein DUNSADRAFT_5857 [Dunaliella salina]